MLIDLYLNVCAVQKELVRACKLQVFAVFMHFQRGG